MATAMYLIDHLALRVGNEKSEDEADTVGCCSLRVEHVTLTTTVTPVEGEKVGGCISHGMGFTSVRKKPESYRRFVRKPVIQTEVKP